MSLFSKVLSIARKLGNEERGTVLIIFGMTVLPVAFMVGASLDYGNALRAKSALQVATDAAALAGASLLAASDQARTTLAQNVFQANLPRFMQTAATAVVEPALENVKVTSSFAVPTTFARIMNVTSIPVAASANVTIDTAIADGSVCLLALGNSSTVEGIALGGNSTIADQKCWAWSNSTSSKSLDAWGSSDATAAGFCAAGGVYGSSKFTPQPLTNCAQRPDPFATLAMPIVGACDYTNKQFNNGTATASPGVYCGGLELKPQATVTFSPGVYIIRNGKLNVQAQSQAIGTGVTIIFSGQGAGFEVKGGGGMDLKAPTSGTYAGFLFVDDRNNKPVENVTITGGGTIKMQGILYMPSRAVNIGGNGQMNQTSSFFAMVADHYSLGGTGDLYMKTNYATAGFPDLLPKVTRLTRMSQ